MKEKFKNKKIVFCVILFVLIIIICVTILLIKNRKKVNQLDEIKKSIENVLFYLPSNKVDNINDIPDSCKLNLVYGTSYLKSDFNLSTEDYDTVVKKNSKNSVKAYSEDAILEALKKVLGEEATFNFDADEEGEYEFITENSCGNNNKNIGKLSYNSEKGYIYTKDEKEFSKIYVKWDEPVIEGDNLYLTAYALLPLLNEDGSYTVYADKNQTYVAGKIDPGKNVDSEILNMYDRALKYKITLKKNGKKYTWINYEIVDDVYNVKYDSRKTTKHQVGG